MKLMLIAGLFAAIAAPSSAAEKTKVVFDFDSQTVPQEVASQSGALSFAPHKNGSALQADLDARGSVTITPKSGKWDWSKSAGVEVDVCSLSESQQDVAIQIWSGKNSITAKTTAKPGEWTTLKLPFKLRSPVALWGMRGAPVYTDQGVDTTSVTAVRIFLPDQKGRTAVQIDNLQLYGMGKSPSDMVKMPFVDRFGQYKHRDWPGKLKSEKDLQKRRSQEEKSLKTAGVLPDRDKFGGWAAGPQLKATGWFRTEKYKGKWWLVDPDGRLFFSIGVDCVRAGESTFIDGRAKWFEELPAENDPLAKYISNVTSSLRMAETIGGKGRAFNFYNANLERKYDSDWRTGWEKMTYERLPSWGFNTIAAWSDKDVYDHSPLPYVIIASLPGNARRIQGAEGFWGRMPDPFDKEFADAVERGVGSVARNHGTNPLCIGFFVDNELSWSAVEEGTLASPADQPCRQEFIRMLTTKYGTIDALNAAWGTKAAGWDALRNPQKPNAAYRGDVSKFSYEFSKRYFETIKSVLRKNAPNHLYLGCRFAWSTKEAVRACADVADVVSFNMYRRGVNSAEWTGKNDLGKPLIIGEFHFGALDRGMFHASLQPTANQQERALAYKRFVESVADCPSFIGCHWFKYNDEPLTGRTLDGENYNCGLVDNCDTPYAELTATAREVGREVYTRRGK